jgi:cytochrome c oxidase subunit IV
MGNLTYEESKKLVFKGLILLAVVTLIEVFVSLFGKGHIVAGMEDLSWVAYSAGFIIIVLSLYKAYFIIYEFMHMKYEVKTMAMSVLLPMLLLVWGVIAFFQEGNAWKNSRIDVEERDEVAAENPFLNDAEIKELLPPVKEEEGGQDDDDAKEEERESDHE